MGIGLRSEVRQQLNPTEKWFIVESWCHLGKKLCVKNHFSRGERR